MDDVYEKTYTLKQEFDSETNKLLREIFYNAAGLLDRDGLPSIIDYDKETGLPCEKWYFKNNKTHRDDGPAIEVICPRTGVITIEFWHQKGKLHRGGKLPAIISRHHETGEITGRRYFLQSMEYRPKVKGVEANRLIP